MKEVFQAIFSSPVFQSGCLAWLCAQGLKVLIYYIRHRKMDFRLFVGTGGMPSAHSALICAVAVSCGMEAGWESPVFVLALFLALIIMTDAAGVRRAAGHQARLLNELMDDLYRARPLRPEKLKELLGHTPVQVIVGALIGVAVALLRRSWL